MTFKLPLDRRRRASESRKARYWSDDAYRLARINEARARRGAAAIDTLSEMCPPRWWPRKGGDR